MSQIESKTNGTLILEKHNITYQDLNPENLNRLISLAHKKMTEHGYIDEFGVNKTPLSKTHSTAILCYSNYFDNRELFTFYANNETGVAGWSSGVIKSALETILDEWCQTLKA